MLCPQTATARGLPPVPSPSPLLSTPASTPPRRGNRQPLGGAGRQQEEGRRFRSSRPAPVTPPRLGTLARSAYSHLRADPGSGGSPPGSYQSPEGRGGGWRAISPAPSPASGRAGGRRRRLGACRASCPVKALARAPAGPGAGAAAVPSLDPGAKRPSSSGSSAGRPRPRPRKGGPGG